MRLLLANDDGIYSPGLAALAAVASELGDVHIVAPDVEEMHIFAGVGCEGFLAGELREIGQREGLKIRGGIAQCIGCTPLTGSGVCRGDRRCCQRASAGLRLRLIHGCDETIEIGSGCERQA